MVLSMTRQDIDERPNGSLRVTRHPNLTNLIVGKFFDHTQRGSSLKRKFLKDVPGSYMIKVVVLYIVILIKTCQWRLISTTDAQGPIGKYLLRIDQMNERLPDGPFSIGIAVIHTVAILFDKIRIDINLL